MRYLITLLLTSSLWLTSVAAQETTLTGTAYQTVNVRSGPDTQFEIIAQLEAGTVVTVNGRESESPRWLRIALVDVEDFPFGWVTAFSITLEGDIATLPVIDLNAANDDDDDPQDPTGDELTVTIIAYGRVNVRSGPGIIYEVTGQLDTGDEAPVFARSNRNSDWLYIEREDFDGWVAFFTVTVLGDPTTLPVRVPDGLNNDLVPPSALVTTRYNVRLRGEPSLQAAVIATVPFDSQVMPIAQTEGGRWLYVVFEDSEGWGLLQLFDIRAEQQARIPVYTPGTTPVPPTPPPLTTPTSTPQTSS